MQRTFTIETSELDEKALSHVHRSENLDFVFNSVLTSIVNGAREQFVRDVRENAKTTGEFVPPNENDVLSSFTLPNADERHAKAIADAEAEAAERQRLEDEKLAAEAAAEEERLRIQQEAIDRAVAAALAAEREKNNASE